MSAPAATLDPAWLRSLATRLDRTPVRPRAALELRWSGQGGAAARIGSVEPALAQQAVAAGLPWHDIGSAWCITAPDARGLDTALEETARWLRTSGLASTWRDERLSVSDTEGRHIAAIERAAVRPLGIATFAVHLVVHDGCGQVWVQQRAFDKSTDPGLWDTTMGGLVSAGETFAQTLERETWEEAGLRIGELQGVAGIGRFTVRRPLAEGYMVEHIEMYEAVLPRQAQAPVNQDGEVERFEQIDRAELVERLHADAFTLEAAQILATWLARTPAPGA